MQDIEEFLSDLKMRITNMIRIGVVKEYSKGKAKIQIGNIITKFITCITLRAGDCVTWWPVSEGEQVVVFSPCGNVNNAIALAGLYTLDNAPPEDFTDKHQVKYKDDATILFEYDKLYQIKLPDETLIEFEYEKKHHFKLPDDTTIEFEYGKHHKISYPDGTIFKVEKEVGHSIEYPDSTKISYTHNDKHSIEYSDGAKFEYDTTSNKLSFETDGEVTIKANKVTLDAEVEIKKKLTAKDIESQQDVKAQGKSLVNHTHTSKGYVPAITSKPN